jgi:hypothetical protein
VQNVLDKDLLSQTHSLLADYFRSAPQTAEQYITEKLYTTATSTATTTATALATTTTTKVEGDVWVNWQRLAAVGEDGWWRRISSSLSECLFS